MCDSARCPQATQTASIGRSGPRTPQNINSVFLGNPRLSKPEQGRARAAFDRGQRILADIDAADTDLNDDTDAAHIGPDADHDQ
jgi:hypothetical protein